MKKGLVLIAVLLLLGLAACGDNSDSVINEDERLANNVTNEAVFGADGRLILLIKNNNPVNVKLSIEVPYHDDEQDITDTEMETIYMRANSELACGFSEVHEGEKVSDISIKAEEDKTNFITTDLAVSSESQVEETLNFKIQNNSSEKLDYMTAVVLFYKDNEIVGMTKAGATNVDAGGADEIIAALPTESNFQKVEFDDYRIIVHGIAYIK